ncbi:hypothetical protein C8R45DRAFT_827512 [Mycena sanguinolenta]|nr:hypothetical protein C8R45DRAFT_827512 [Mycena sanguinolenta]
MARGGAVRGEGGAEEREHSSIPKWAADAQKLLEDGECSEEFQAATILWRKREEAASFQGPARGTGAGVRLVEVKGWVVRARTGGPSPPIKNAKDFGTRFWNWWVSINPDWRARVGGGQRMAQERDGGWEGLASQTGPNGLLNAMICLRWWRDELKEECTEWKEAVTDVR